MTQPRAYDFGDFRLDTRASQLLTRDGQPLPLTPRAFDTLLYLVEHPGVLVGKDELMREIWPDTVVEENNLNQAISTVRRALGETAGENRYVVTVPGRGYRFVPQVRPAEAAEDRPPAQPRNRLRVAVVVGAAVVLTLLISLAVQTARARRPIEPPAATTRSIAVLPFKPLVPNQREESLEMGMADTLIVQLGNVERVRVQPITSVRRYGGIEQDAVAAGRALGVESVLEGTIQKAENRIRVTARLLRVSDGSQLWAGQFDEDFTNVFSVQDAISRRILLALALRLTSDEQTRIAESHPSNTEAYELYLAGRLHWQARTVDSLNAAIDYFSRAIERDPNYALAHAGLADAYAILGVFHVRPAEAFPKSRVAALNALRIDERLGEAHASLAHIKVQYEYDWAGAETAYRRAIALNPNYANSRHFFAIYLAARGRFEESLTEIARARELDPTSPFIQMTAANILFQARRFDESLVEVERALELSSEVPMSQHLAGHVYLEKRMFDQAVRAFQKSGPLAPAGLARAYALANRREEALAEIERFTSRPDEHYAAAYHAALAFAALGEKERALDWLDIGHRERSTLMIWTNVDPRLDSLHGEPRFRALVKTMRLE